MILITFIIILCIIALLIARDKKIGERKLSLLNAIVPMVFEDSKFLVSPRGISSYEFKDSDLYPKFDSYVSSDGVTLNDGDIQFSNVKADKLVDKDVTQNVFKGIVIVQKLDDLYENDIVIKPDVENKLISSIKDTTNKLMNNMQNVVRLENPEFEKYFEVYSKDQYRARQVVTVEYMENLVELRKKLKAPIKIRYYGNRKYIAIWNHRIIDEKKLIYRNSNVKDIKKELQLIKEVIEKC